MDSLITENNGSPAPTSEETATPSTIAETTSQKSQQSSQDEVSNPAGETNTVADALAAFENIGKQSFVTPAEAANEQQKQIQESEQSSAPGQTKFKRDFTGLTQEDAKIFSRMPDDSYKKLYPIYRNQQKIQETLAQRDQELEEARRQSSYDVDGAWKLRPEYNELNQQTQMAAHLANHWQEQLANIRAGEKCTLITGFDQQGNPVYSDPLDGTPRLEAAIINAMQQANSQYAQSNAQLQSMEGSYKTQHQSYLKGLQAAEKQVFQGVDEKRLEAAAAKKLELFPSYIRGKPEIKLVAKALVFIDGFRALLQEKENRTASGNMQRRISANSGPTVESIRTGNSGETVADALAEFNRLLR
jgi:hypothetical protein